MNRFKFASAGAMLAAIFAGAPAKAVTIDFDGTGAPSQFVNTVPLTTLFSGLGVTFSAAASGNPGSILNQSGGFGINARSGTDFLAFNTIVGAVSDRLSFSSPASNFSIYVGYGGVVAIFTANYYDSTNALIDSQTIFASGGFYGKLFHSGPVSFVDISSSSSAWVADDLSFDVAVAPAVPEPATWAMMLSGFGIVGGALRRSRRPVVAVARS